MNGIRYLSALSRTPRTWRNGGGATSEIVLVPEGGGPDDFQWRASIATIATNGPFSKWPGTDRALILLRGTLMLAVGARGNQLLDACSPSQLFAGEDEVFARPLDGPCYVLNIMTRRGHIHTLVERWIAGRPSAAEQLLLLAPQPMAVRFSGISIDLRKDDALLIAANVAIEFEFDNPLIVAELFTEQIGVVR